MRSRVRSVQMLVAATGVLLLAAMGGLQAAHAEIDLLPNALPGSVLRASGWTDLLAIGGVLQFRLASAPQRSSKTPRVDSCSGLRPAPSDVLARQR